MNTPLALTVPLAAVLLILAAGAAATAVGGWKGTLSRGGALGLRTQAAQKSDNAFAVGTKVAAPVYGGAAAVGLLAAVLVLFLPMPTALILVIAALGLVAVVTLAVAGSSLGEKAARLVPVPAAKPASGGGCGGCACGTGGGCGGLTRKTDAAASQA